MATKDKNDVISISFFDIILPLAKHWKMIVFVPIIVAVALVLICIGSLVLQNALGPKKSYLPNYYEMTCSIVFNDNSNSSGFSLGSGGGDNALLKMALGSMGGGKTQTTMLARLLESEELLDTLIDEFDLLKDEGSKSKYPRQLKRKEIVKGFTIKVDTKDSSIIDIIYKDIDPEFGEKFLMRAVELLGERYKVLSQDKARDMVSYYNDALVVTEARLEQKLKELTDFQKKYNVPDPEKLIELKTMAVLEVEKDIQSLYMKRDQIAQYQGYGSTQAKQVLSEIRQLESHRDNLIKGSSITSKYNLPISKLIEIVPEYTRITRELKGLQEILTGLKVQEQAKQMEVGSSLSTFQILARPNFFAKLQEGESPAEMPMKSGPSRGKIVVFGTFIAGFLMIFLAYIKEFMSTVKIDPEESEKLYQIKSYLPFFRRKLR